MNMSIDTTLLWGGHVKNPTDSKMRIGNGAEHFLEVKNQEASTAQGL